MIDTYQFVKELEAMQGRVLAQYGDVGDIYAKVKTETVLASMFSRLKEGDKRVVLDLLRGM